MGLVCRVSTKARIDRVEYVWEFGSSFWSLPEVTLALGFENDAKVTSS